MTDGAAIPKDAEAVLDFWYRECGPERWFEKDAALDGEIRARFGALNRAACAGLLDAWTETPRGALALIVLIDQFSRNIHRDAPEAFAGDARALELVDAALGAGHDKAMTRDECIFLYMPLMHSEDLDDQERCIALMRDAGLEKQHGYAVAHRDVIARFGRFPHRNAVLGRASTPEEEAFLKEPGSSF